jgi:hypothetical protein
VRILACCGFMCVALGCTSSSGGNDVGPTCSAFGASDLADGSTTCSLHYASCSDGLTYTVTCPGPPALCSCQVDGGAAAQFDGGICGLSPTSPSLLTAVDDGCGWDIR